MQHVSISLLLLLGLSYSVQAQSITITYKEEIYYSRLIKSALKTDAFNLPETLISIHRLIFADNRSVYYLLEEKSDTIKSKHSTKDGSKTVVYKDFGNMVTYNESLSSPGIVSKEPLHFEDWNLKYDETMEILGHRCKKATKVDAGSGGLVNAWYAPDIPVPDGPTIFYGLPGMVLSAENLYFKIIATDLATNSEAVEIRMPQAEKYVTKTEFKQLTRPDKN